MEKIPAAPIPAIALHTISMIMDYTKVLVIKSLQEVRSQTLTVATPQSKEPNKKTTVPKSKIDFLPKISENFAKRGSTHKM